MNITKEANILIIEDQEINVRLLRGMLLKEGYTNVLFTSDAREAMPLFRRFQPDVVLLDLHMPHFDGFELMDQFSAHTWGDYLPILVLTGDVSAGTRQRALESGAMDFINKPFKVSEVLLRVSNFLQARLLHLQLKKENQRLEAVVRLNHLRVEAAQIEVLERLVAARENGTIAEKPDKWDPDAERQHPLRVAQLAAQLGSQLGLSPLEIDLMSRAARLHDVGKITIPDSIALKPGRLTPDEFERMKAHVQCGVNLLRDGQSEMLQMAEKIALTHHEKWDGSGYPQGLAGEAIPLVGRIVALADVYDALLHQRSYKEAWGVEKARAEILAQSGHHFDPAVVEAFFDHLEAEALAAQAEADARALAEMEDKMPDETSWFDVALIPEPSPAPQLHTNHWQPNLRDESADLPALVI